MNNTRYLLVAWLLSLITSLVPKDAVGLRLVRYIHLWAEEGVIGAQQGSGDRSTDGIACPKSSSHYRFGRDWL